MMGYQSWSVNSDDVTTLISIQRTLADTWRQMLASFVSHNINYVVTLQKNVLK